MKRIHEITLAVALMSVLAPGFSSGAADIADADTNATATRSMQNGMAYITGGVGIDEADALRSVAHQYSLRLTFLAQGGQFLSDVDVEIVGPSGAAVFRTRTLGPYLYVALPPGRYQVAAYAAGTKQVRVVVVNRRQGTNVQFAFVPAVRHAVAPCCPTPPTIR
ncbi:hypothetical protein FHX57_006931 [Paraburkholderia tropica]|uniref:carboxypeptidase regulatory-like domain-containing protein n=1 Tax=Paraburkholderia TaxID=1822464 RepID=UPI001617D60D|nr:carboxypeptidase regulatory-like domain-containing protein [Paraburkholderia tropica]MBB3004548.1 hypothetical protein [Paraburkholderia tropica]MBB6323671.1 hypothetical protein [Paraburkholderia tropica]